MGALFGSRRPEWKVVYGQKIAGVEQAWEKVSEDKPPSQGPVLLLFVLQVMIYPQGERRAPLAQQSSWYGEGAQPMFAEWKNFSWSPLN